MMGARGGQWAAPLPAPSTNGHKTFKIYTSFNLPTIKYYLLGINVY